MHLEAYEWLRTVAQRHPRSGKGLEFGAYDVNGSGRDWWPNVKWTGIDLRAGPGVDVVSDLSYGLSPGLPGFVWDIVLCTEVFEHCRFWPGIIGAAWEALGHGGLFVVTSAGPGRRPHSGYDGGPIQPGEWYHNPNAEDLETHTRLWGFHDISVEYDPDPCDLYMEATKP